MGGARGWGAGLVAFEGGGRKPPFFKTTTGSILKGFPLFNPKGFPLFKTQQTQQRKNKPQHIKSRQK